MKIRIIIDNGEEFELSGSFSYIEVSLEKEDHVDDLIAEISDKDELIEKVYGDKVEILRND